MNKKAKRKGYKALAAYVALFAVSLFAVGGLVKAYSGVTSGDVLESGAVKNVYYQVAESAREIGEVLIGAANRPIFYVYDFVNGLYVSGSQIFDSSANATLPGTLAITGATTVTGPLTVSGGTSLASTTVGGSVTTLTLVSPTTTVTAAEFCDSTFIQYSATTSGAIDLALPTSTTLFSACLSATGKSHAVLLYNASTTVGISNILAGSGVDLLGSPTTTAAYQDIWAGGEYRRLIMTRVGAVVKAELIGYKDAD